ncbi:MAG: plasmid recombination protein [Bacilli bacterium]
MYIVEKNFGSKCEVKQKAYEQSVAHYTSQAKLWALRGCESTNKAVRRGNSTHFAQRLQKTNFRRKIIISYLVCHMEKYHKQDVAPIEKENERDENYEASNPQIDSERTRNNYRFTPYFGKTYTEFINGRIKELGLSPRKDAVVMNSFVVGSDKQFFDGLSKVERYNFFSDSL